MHHTYKGATVFLKTVRRTSDLPRWKTSLRLSCRPTRTGAAAATGRRHNLNCHPSHTQSRQNCPPGGSTSSRLFHACHSGVSRSPQISHRYVHFSSCCFASSAFLAEFSWLAYQQVHHSPSLSWRQSSPLQPSTRGDTESEDAWSAPRGAGSDDAGSWEFKEAPGTRLEAPIARLESLDELDQGPVSQQD